MPWEGEKKVSYSLYQVVELHPDPLQLCGGGEVVPGDDEEGGEVDAGVLVGLDLEAAAVPVDRLLEGGLVSVPENNVQVVEKICSKVWEPSVLCGRPAAPLEAGMVTIKGPSQSPLNLYLFPARSQNESFVCSAK